MNDYIIKKSPQEIALSLYENIKNLDYEDEKESVLNDFENALYYLKAIADNKYNADYFRTFYKALERL